jgi:TRAP-type mannitol/chloroaromatic compound transport system permease small subunit
MRTIIRIIDSISEWTGKVIMWLPPTAMLIIVWQVVVRYGFDRPAIWAYEISIMVVAAMYALGWTYVHRHGGHIRVDVFYSYLSPRGKAILDTICALLLFFPLLGAMIYVSGSWAWFAWVTGEKSTLTFWHPPIAPLRTAVFLGICLFTLQGISQFIRDLYLLMGKDLGKD